MPVPHRFIAVGYFLSECCAALWSCLKHCVKRVIGRSSTFDPEYPLLLWRKAAYLSGLRPIRSITVSSYQDEGAGSQARMFMNAITFARAAGITYLHSPFATMCDADRPMPEWVKLWENHFNFGSGEALCSGERGADVNWVELWFYAERRPGALQWLDLPVPQQAMFNQHDFVTSLPAFKKKYYLNKTGPRHNPVLVVAVHIRRGDVSASSYSDYYTPNSAILKTLERVLAVLDQRGMKYKIAVYSQGSVADFQELALPGVEFFINEDTAWTLSELVEADVLVMAKGTFGRYAALVSDGIKLCEAGDPLDVFQPLGDWVLRTEDGSFDSAAFERQLALLQTRNGFR